LISLAAAMKVSPGVCDFERCSISAIQRGSEDLAELVNESLENSKLWSDGMSVQMSLTSMQETLGSVVTASDKMAAARGGVRIDTCYDSSVPDSVTTDGGRLEEILNLLLEHAIKQSRENGSIKFGVSAVAAKDILSPSELKGDENGSFLRFIIKDDSLQGFSKEELANIFKPYQRGADAGLAVAAKLVDDLGGIIQVKSKVGGSTKITVGLPFEGSPVDADNLARKFQRTTVFIVGDNPSDNLFLAMLAKYQVEMVKLGSCGDMEALIQSENATVKQRVHLCLVQEDLYRSKAFEKIEKESPAVLLSFGPQHLVKDSKAHFLSLTRTLPCVIAKSMIACISLTSTTQPSQFRRLPSMRESKSSSFDYSEVRALIAEDNKINQKVLQRMLRRKGIKYIDVVEDGQKAVDAIYRDRKEYGKSNQTICHKSA